MGTYEERWYNSVDLIKRAIESEGLEALRQTLQCFRNDPASLYSQATGLCDKEKGESELRRPAAPKIVLKENPDRRPIPPMPRDRNEIEEEARKEEERKEEERREEERKATEWKEEEEEWKDEGWEEESWWGQPRGSQDGRKRKSASYLDEQICRVCGGRGHWGNECPSGPHPPGTGKKYKSGNRYGIY